MQRLLCPSRHRHEAWTDGGRVRRWSTGPDVWEVIGALHALRDEGPSRHGGALYGELRTATGLTTAQVAAAPDYYTAHPEDVDTRIAGNTEAAEPGQRPPTAAGSPTRNQAI